MTSQGDGPTALDTGRRTLILLGLTCILLGYFMVWLPSEVAGLSFIGLEIGEWVKFLPQVRAGQIAADRNLFYLPPITLGLMLVLWTVGWPNRRWTTWAMRGLAVGVAMLALPAIEAVLYEDSDQWVGRILMVAFVILAAVLVSLLQRLPSRTRLAFAWSGILLASLIGLILPTWAYFSVRPAIEQLLGHQVGVGPGLWLNGIGHVMVAAVAVTRLLERRMAPVNATSQGIE